jgi:hypothetical protein
MDETWYVMENGSLGDPHEIGHDAAGKLRHNDGRAVAYGPHGPRSRGGVDADAERAKARKTKTRQLKPEEPVGGGYKTREAKAEQ